MKTHIRVAMAAVGIALLCSASFAALKEGVRLKADGEIIDVEVGHLVPCAIDWNEDGKKDVVAGQFSGGRIRLYLNDGADGAPVLRDAGFLSAGGAEIRLPAG